MSSLAAPAQPVPSAEPLPVLVFTFEIAIEGNHIAIRATDELAARRALAEKLDRCGYRPNTSVRLVSVERTSQVRSTSR